MILLHSILVFECTPPVSAFPTVLNIVENVCRNVIRPIQFCTCSIKGIFINHVHVLLSIEKLWTLVGVRPTNSTIVSELDLAFLTLLGGYQDNAVCSTRTIDGCGCCILQYIDRLDIVGVNTIEVSTSYTVNDVKRLRVTSSTDTADINLISFTRL